jgi:hypothetical protein
MRYDVLVILEESFHRDLFIIFSSSMPQYAKTRQLEY